MKRFAFGNNSWLLPLLLLALLGGLYLYLLKPDVAGFFYDDGMYLMAAKGLMSGQGYRLTGMAGQPWFYKYPPLYPLCLAMGLWRTSAFSACVFFLKGLNVLFSLTSLGLLFYHLRKQQYFSAWLSWGLVFLVGTNWRWIEVSIEMMSEPLFMLLSLSALILAHRYFSGLTVPSKKQWCFLILLSVAAFYTRSMGIVLIASLAVWIGLRTTLKNAVAYLLISGALLLPWLLWTGTKPDTTYTIGDFLVRSFQESYFQSYRMDLQYEYTFPELIGKGLQELTGNLSVQFFPLLERLFLLRQELWAALPIPILSAVLCIFLSHRLFQAIRNKKYSLLGIYVSLYALILQGWSFYDFYPRFLIVMVPFLWILLIQGIRESTYSQPAKKWWMVCLIALGIGTNLIHLTPYLRKPYPNTLAVDTSKNLWASYQQVFQFIKTYTAQNALIYTDITDEGYLYALNAQRKMLDLFVQLPEKKLDIICPAQTQNLLACYGAVNVQRALVIREILRRQKVAYLIYNDFGTIKTPKNDGRLIQRVMPLIPILVKRFPDEIKPIFQSSDHWITVYQLKSATLSE